MAKVDFLLGRRSRPLPAEAAIRQLRKYRRLTVTLWVMDTPRRESFKGPPEDTLQ